MQHMKGSVCWSRELDCRACLRKVRRSPSPPRDVEEMLQRASSPHATLHVTLVMSQRALTLPLRPRFPRPQWICRRCLATEVDATTPSADPIPPPSETPLPSAVKPLGRTRQKPSPLTGNAPERFLATRLPHRIPPQYLQHSTSDDLNSEEKKEREQAEKHSEIRGVVVSAGLMDKTVRVRVPGRRWNKKLGKVYKSNR